VSGQPQLRLAKSANSTISATLIARVLPPSSTTPVAEKTFGLDNVAPTTGSLAVQYRRIVLEPDFANLSATTTRGTSQTLFRGDGATDPGGVGGVTYEVAFRVGGSTVATATLPNRPSPGVTVSGLSNFVIYSVTITAVEDALGNRATVSFTPVSFQLADAPITLGDFTVDNINPNAGGTFNITSFTPGGGVGTLTSRVALKLGNRLVDFSGTTGVTALFGAQYVLYVVDQAGNFAVADLPVTVRQPASDNTPPAITVSLPSSVAPSSTFNVSGTYSDPNPPSPTNNVQIYRSHGSLGGFEWYRTAPASVTVGGGGSYGPTSLTAPSYTGSLGVVVLGRDNLNNLGSATGTVDVRP
jgi:hypothetical protein